MTLKQAQVLDTTGRILEFLTPLLALAAGVLAVRGNRWDEAHGRPTRFGWWALLLAGLTMIVSISSSLVSHELAENAKTTADREKNVALAEQSSRFDQIDHATADQLVLLREQLLKQSETLAVASATRQSQMLVESVTLNFIAAPPAIQRIRRHIHASYPMVEDSDQPFVSYDDRDPAILLINGKDVASGARDSIRPFLSSLWFYTFGLEIVSAAATEVISPSRDLISHFSVRNSGVFVELSHLQVSAAFFYNHPVYFHTFERTRSSPRSFPPRSRSWSAEPNSLAAEPVKSTGRPSRPFRRRVARAQ
jgi:hypothetical protein